MLCLSIPVEEVTGNRSLVLSPSTGSGRADSCSYARVVPRVVAWYNGGVREIRVVTSEGKFRYDARRKHDIVEALKFALRSYIRCRERRCLFPISILIPNYDTIMVDERTIGKIRHCIALLDRYEFRRHGHYDYRVDNNQSAYEIMVNSLRGRRKLRLIHRD